MRSRLRAVLESGLYAVLTMPLVLRLLGGRPTAPAAARRRVIRQQGLRPLREQWWTPLSFEPAATLWRYVLALECTAEPEASAAPVRTEVRRVVVYTPGHLGDILQTAPLLRALRTGYPSARVTWIVGPWGEQLARRCNQAHEVIVRGPAWYHYHRGRAAWRTTLRQDLAWAAGNGSCDVFISTARTDLSAQWIGRSLHPRMWCALDDPSPLYPVAPLQHVVRPERDLPQAADLMRLLEPLGLVGQDTRLAYPLTDAERQAARELLRREGAAPDRPYFAVVPGAGWPGKMWPADRFAQAADALAAGRSWTAVLLGSPDERELAESVRRAMRSPALNLAGRTSVAEMAAVLEGARLFLGNDSGPLHLAAALQIPTVSLFGPTSPGKWAPQGPQHVALRKVEQCPQCFPWHPRATCAEQGRCLKLIAVPEVVQAMEQVLAAISGPPQE